MSVARLARSESARSASTIRNVASERRSAPKISTTFAYAHCCTDRSFGVPLTSKGPCLLHLQNRKGRGMQHSANRLARTLLCYRPPELAACSGAHHRRGDHDGARPHGHTHLQKRVSFSEHSPPFSLMESAIAGARRTARWPSR